MFATAPQITSAGSNLVKRAMLGETITFTRFALGDGELDEDADAYEFTDLISSVMDVGISNIESLSDESVALSGSFDSSEIESDFSWREFGVFCKGEDDVEELFAYANDGEDSGLLRANCSDVTVEQIVRYVIQIVGAANVSAEITSVMTASEALEVHVSDTENPHEVTAEQVGLGNVNNTSDEDKPVSTAQSEAIEAVYNKSERSNEALIAQLLGWSVYDGDFSTSDLVAFGEKTVMIPDADSGTEVNFVDAQLNTNMETGTYYVANLTGASLTFVTVKEWEKSEGDVTVAEYDTTEIEHGYMATITFSGGMSDTSGAYTGSISVEAFDPIGELAAIISGIE